MSKYIYIGFMLILLSCQKEDIVSYSLEKDCLQFDYSVEGMSLSYNFAGQSKVLLDEWGYPSYYYYGDSLTRDTLSLFLSLIGRAGDEDRGFKLKTVPLVDLDTLPLATVEFLPSYVFKANQLKDTIQIVLIRPEKRGHFGVGVTFDIEDGNASFDVGVEEKSIYALRISDRYEEPSWWSMRIPYLGEYSEEKHAFVVSLTHVALGYYSSWNIYNQMLRDELERFNNAHPDNPKDFTFPVNTNPIW